VLDPPSLKDVSKNPTPEDDNQQVRNSWGEAAVQRYEHEVSTDSSRDREESVSEASQSVAAGFHVYDIENNNSFFDRK